VVDFSELNPFENFLERKAKRRGGHASDERRPREKVVSRSDGRSARSKGKTITVNYRVTPEWKKQLEALAKEEEVTMTEVLERALELYGKSRKRKR
jgi:hypothetical protein